MTEENSTTSEIGKQIKLNKERLAQAERLKLTVQEIAEIEKDTEALATRALELKSKDLSLTEEQRTKNFERYRAKKETLELEKQATAELKRQLEIQQRQGKAVEGFFNSWRGGLTESILETGIQLKDIGRSLKNNITLTNIGGMAAQAMLQSTTAAVYLLDSSMADLAKATGTGREYQDLVMDSARGAASLGVGIQQSAQAVQALNNGMSTFRGLNDTARQSITQTVSSLVALGVSGEDAAFGMDFATRTMGLGAEQAEQFTDDLGKFAMDIGKSVAQTISELKASAPALASYGKNAGSVFKELQVQSRKTGIEMGSLISIAQQFDTFEGAATAAGNLNSLLGGKFLDSMQLLSAETLAQKNALIQSAVQMSGKSYDSMSRHLKMSLANAVGISDMTTANNLFSESSRAAAEATMFGSMTMEEYNKKKEESQSITNKAKIALEQFAIAVSPVVEGLTYLLNKFLQLNDEFPLLIPTIGSIAVALGLMATAASVLAPILAVVGTAGTAALPALSGGLFSLTPAIPVILTLTAAMVGFGAAVWMVGNGIESVLDGISGVFTAMEGFAQTAGSGPVVKFISVIESIEDANVENLKQVVDQAERYVEVQATINAASAATSIASSVEKLLNLATGASSEASSAGKRDVVLKLDDREFARAVVGVLDANMKLNVV